MFRITDYVMAFAPIAVFAAIASAITVQGPKLILIIVFSLDSSMWAVDLMDDPDFFRYIFLKKIFLD
jgi:hypothetical protein